MRQRTLPLAAGRHGRTGGPRRRPQHLEDAAQAHLFTWLRLTRYQGRPIADLAWHTPNGGRRHPREAARLKAMGVKPGVPDVFVAIPRNGLHGLFIELKAGRNKPTEAQAALHADLRAAGFSVAVAYGWHEAANQVAEYLGLPLPWWNATIESSTSSNK